MKRFNLDHETVVGYAWMSVAVLIWASWLVLTTSGRTTTLSVLDLAGFRALIPTLFLAPLLWRRRRQLFRIGIIRCMLLSLYGAPFSLCVGTGLSFAPVAHAGALVPGLMPVFAAVLGVVFLGQRLNVRQMVSFLLILSASAVVVFQVSVAPSADDIWIGHVLFLLGALFWACFAVTMRALGVSPYLATAIVGTVSSAIVAPFWMLSGLSALGSASIPDILFQTVFQGALSGLVSLFAFTQALRLLGIGVSALSALTPGVATLLAMPVLGQMPGHIETMALVVVVPGLAVGTLNSTNASSSR
ncbi:EamA-like transporter family protein [Roseovarius albus]|uniref:EamA-like transporter family protein n=1 Tax=Roseovarius albus TaxID=1247867 RepID=A0A1X7A4T9_9RHOB|nr:DMT family transporter [Roseovarius albus]SLN70072.1 EamA-like transporter family protein [Roseovarius albus]